MNISANGSTYNIMDFSGIILQSVNSTTGECTVNTNYAGSTPAGTYIVSIGNNVVFKAKNSGSQYYWFATQ